MVLTLTGSLFHRGISWADQSGSSHCAITLGLGTRVLQTAHCMPELPSLTDAAVTAIVVFLMSFIKGLRCYKQVVV